MMNLRFGNLQVREDADGEPNLSRIDVMCIHYLSSTSVCTNERYPEPVARVWSV